MIYIAFISYIIAIMNPIRILNWFTHFLFENAHKMGVSSAKSNVAMRIKNAQRFKRVSFMQANVPLGRWKIHNNRQTGLKIKYANEDNCGISGINYKNTRQIEINNGLYDDPYIYIMGYESIPK